MLQSLLINQQLKMICHLFMSNQQYQVEDLNLVQLLLHCLHLLLLVTHHLHLLLDFLAEIFRQCPIHHLHLHLYVRLVLLVEGLPHLHLHLYLPLLIRLEVLYRRHHRHHFLPLVFPIEIL
jgi:hypothetical protein